MKNFSSTGGCIVVDKKDKIVFANDIAKELLSLTNDKLITTSLKDISEDFFKLDYDCIKTELHTVYWINGPESRDFISTILESSFDEIFIADKDGRTIYCNKTFEKHYGISCEDIIGKNILDFVGKGYIDRTFLPQVIKEKRAITYEQKTSVGKTILNTTIPILDDNGQLLFIVENCRDITEINELKSHLYEVQEELIEVRKDLLLDKDEIHGPAFKSKAMVEINALVEKMAPKDVNILILGKSGTGKTALAKKIHQLSTRKNKPFVSINCSTIPDNLLESELFGYEKGAFTGASERGKIGLVEKAKGGTLFLDEIGDMPLPLQAKLLEFVQEHTFMPVGSTKSKKIDVRILSATNQNLIDMIKNKTFREDLYYRLSVVSIKIPPLSERRDDISQLINYYISYYNTKHQFNRSLSSEGETALLNYSYPGNIRELEHLMEFLILNNNDDTIDLLDMPTYILNQKTLYEIAHSDLDPKSSPNMNLSEMLELEEGRIIRQFYKKYNSSYKLAEKLGLSQSKAYRLICKYCSI